MASQVTAVPKNPKQIILDPRPVVAQKPFSSFQVIDPGCTHPKFKKWKLFPTKYCTQYDCNNYHGNF